MGTPYVGFSGETLGGQPRVVAGDMVFCGRCGKVHRLEGSEPAGLLLSYRCGGGAFLGAVDGRLVAGLRPDVSGVYDEDG